jgi:VWFA-related protein
MSAALLACGMPPAYAQSSPSPQQKPSAAQSPNLLKASTRLVVVDVVATDHSGAAVGDLSIDDFTVLENGVAQKISNFGFQHPMGVSATPLSLPPNVFTNVPQVSATSLNVILVDGLNGEFSSRAYARDQLVKYLEGHPSIPPTAIYGLDTKLKLLHGFTTESKELVEAVRDFKPQVMTHISTVYATASPFTQKGDFQSSELTMMNTLGALDLLAQSLSGYAGRKNLIWLSEAFPETLFPDLFPSGSATNILGIKSPPSGAGVTAVGAAQEGMQQSSMSVNPVQWAEDDYSAMVRRVADELMSAQVAVYPIDAAGVGKISRVNGLATMRQMAERTGGKTFANQNDLVLSISHSLEDGATYYTLSYYPENKNWDGRFRQIDVKSNRPGINLRHRVGYYAMDPGAAVKAEDPKRLSADFSRALALDAPSSTAVLFRVVLGFPADDKQKVVVNFAIDPHTLSFAADAEAGEHASVACAVVAFSSKGSLANQQLYDMKATVKPGELSRLMESTFPCRVAIELKPGKYTLRLGVVDHASQHMGTTTATVSVP